MTPRLRSMTIDGERFLLVLDRLGAEPDEAQRFAATARQMGATGGMVFSGEVQLGDDETVDVAGEHSAGLFADEIEALRWLDASASAVDDGSRPASQHLAALRLLLDRATR